MKKNAMLILAILFVTTAAFAQDWPIYKGNIFFTGNNDEITVKNNNLKWLFQADDTVFNPIVSDSRVYFIDMKNGIYCVNEDNGKLIWKTALKDIASQFQARARSAGRVKYPLIKDNWLFITDPTVIYCLDKRNGKVIWARTGLRDEKNPAVKKTFDVDGIFQDPVVSDNNIFYGTRTTFLSRDISNGHLQWDKKDVKSFSGFPSFYDKYIFTQSMDYSTNRFSVICLLSDSGETVWQRNIEKPIKIFSPVVFKKKLYLPVSQKIYCMDVETGTTAWEKDFGEIITSNPSFTESDIVFSLGNRKIVNIDPDNGAIRGSIETGEQSSPYFVIIRDQVYVARSYQKDVSGKSLPYTSLISAKLGTGEKTWEFTPPFPGPAHQPSASKGIMFLPSGNYVYAVGTDYYTRVVDGGSGYYDPKKEKGDATERIAEGKTSVVPEKENAPRPLPMRKIKLDVSDKNGSPLSAGVEVKKWDNGKLVYSGKERVNGKGEISVPDLDGVEITAWADGHAPDKVIIDKKDSQASMKLERIEKGKSVSLDSIYFEIDQSHLTKDSLNLIDRMIDAMKRDKKIKLEVRGHTDSTGPREHNINLSKRRASAVADYMIKNGISPERLSSAGVGPDRPVADNKTEAGRKKNRRTEFFIIDK